MQITQQMTSLERLSQIEQSDEHQRAKELVHRFLCKREDECTVLVSEAYYPQEFYAIAVTEEEADGETVEVQHYLNVSLFFGEVEAESPGLVRQEMQKVVANV